MQTRVCIIGGGPSGLMLSQLLHLKGIDNVVLSVHCHNDLGLAVLVEGGRRLGAGLVRLGDLHRASDLVVVDVGLLGHAGLVEVLLGLAVLRAVPQQVAALALTLFELRVALLEAVDELGRVGLVGLPEERHGGRHIGGKTARHFTGR